MRNHVAESIRELDCNQGGSAMRSLKSTSWIILSAANQMQLLMFLITESNEKSFFDQRRKCITYIFLAGLFSNF